MFNAEKLLGKVLSEVMGSSSGKKGKNNLLNSLSSGAGLMTAIGLGVGAYEIYKDKQAQAQSSNSHSQPAGYSQPQHGGTSAAPPPPPPGSRMATAPPPPPRPSAPGNTPPEQSEAVGRPPVVPVGGPPPVEVQAEVPVPAELPAEQCQNIAVRMIQVMISAAYADGILDPQEEENILNRLKKSDLSAEERMFFLDELHNPKPIAEITAGMNDPATARTVYMLAVSAIEIDTPEERQWLDQLAAALGLSKAMQDFIEES